MKSLLSDKTLELQKRYNEISKEYNDVSFELQRAIGKDFSANIKEGDYIIAIKKFDSTWGTVYYAIKVNEIVPHHNIYNSTVAGCGMLINIDKNGIVYEVITSNRIHLEVKAEWKSFEVVDEATFNKKIEYYRTYENDILWNS